MRLSIVKFICDCKHIDKHFVHPPINFIICKKCGKLHSTNNLRVWIILFSIIIFENYLVFFGILRSYHITL